MLTQRWLAKDIMTVGGFFTPQECDRHIALSEARGYEDAPVTTGAGVVMMKDLRNNDRVMVDDVAGAADLYARVHRFLPERFKKLWTPVGVNERLRYYRYDVGQQFDWHRDGVFERQNGERSHFTFMIYLNDGFDGGGTSFEDDRMGPDAFGRLQVRPEKGMALIFNHPIMHKGEPVERGRKYVLRTDVMFARR